MSRIIDRRALVVVSVVVLALVLAMSTTAYALGKASVGEPREELVASRKGRALVQLVELHAGDDLAVASTELVWRRGQRPIEDDDPPTWA